MKKFVLITAILMSVGATAQLSNASEKQNRDVGEIQTVDPDNPAVVPRNNLNIDTNARADIDISVSGTQGIVKDINKDKPETDANIDMFNMSNATNYTTKYFQRGYDEKVVFLPKVDSNTVVTTKLSNVGKIGQKNVGLREEFSKIEYVDYTEFHGASNPELAGSSGMSAIRISSNAYSGILTIGMKSAVISRHYYDTETGEDILDLGTVFENFNSVDRGEFVGAVDNIKTAYVSDNTLLSHIEPWYKTNVNQKVFMWDANTDKNATDVANESLVKNKWQYVDKLGSPSFVKNTVTFQLNRNGSQYIIGAKNGSQWLSTTSATVGNALPEKPTKDVFNVE